MKMLNVIIAVILVFALTTCSTIITGTNKQINITSDPSEAKVLVTNVTTNMPVFNGVTPTTVILNKGEGYFKGAVYRVDIEKEGYAKQSVNVKASVTGWYILGNILIGGLIGWLIVDPVSGGMWNLSPENVTANLQKAVTWNDNEGGLHIVLKSSIPDDVFDQLVLEKL